MIICIRWYTRCRKLPKRTSMTSESINFISAILASTRTVISQEVVPSFWSLLLSLQVRKPKQKPSRDQTIFENEHYKSNMQASLFQMPNERIARLPKHSLVILNTPLQTSALSSDTASHLFSLLFFSISLFFSITSPDNIVWPHSDEKSQRRPILLYGSYHLEPSWERIFSIAGHPHPRSHSHTLRICR